MFVSNAGKHSWRKKVKDKLEELAKKDDVIIVEVLAEGQGLQMQAMTISFHFVLAQLFLPLLSTSKEFVPESSIMLSPIK